MIESIVQKNKAATRHLLSITNSAYLENSPLPSDTKSIVETVQEIQASLNSNAIPENEVPVAHELLQVYTHLKTHFSSHKY